MAILTLHESGQNLNLLQGDIPKYHNRNKKDRSNVNNEQKKEEKEKVC